LEDTINHWMERVSGVLEAMSKDKNLQEDLRDSEVMAAMSHWTGECRLPADVAARRFNDNGRVKEVMSKLHLLTSASQEANMGVPIKALLAGSKDPFCGLQFEESTAPDSMNQTESVLKIDQEPIEPVAKIDAVNQDQTEPDTKIDAARHDQIDPVTQIASNLENPAPSLLDIFSLELSFENVSLWWSFQILFLAIFWGVL